MTDGPRIDPQPPLPGSLGLGRDTEPPRVFGQKCCRKDTVPTGHTAEAAGPEWGAHSGVGFTFPVQTEPRGRRPWPVPWSGLSNRPPFPLKCRWGLGREGRKYGRVVRTRVCWDV